MPSFVNMASLTKLTSLTGNEEFQVSATQKVTAQQIAELSLSQMLSGFSTLKGGKPSITANIALLSAIQILYKLSSNGSVMSISNGTDKFGTVTYSGSDAVGILFDVKASKYYTRSGATTPTSYTDAQWITWLQDGNVYEMGGSTGVADPIQIHDFAEVSAIDNWPTPKDGLIIPFTTDSGVLNKPGNESEYVGIIICEVDTQQTGRAEVIAYGSGTGSCYIGLLDWTSISIEWMVNKLSVSSKKLSAFTGTAIGNYIQSMGNAGDLFPFVTVNANKTTANQFPANGAWSGFVTIGDGGGVNIIAFKSTTDPNAEVYVGRCSGGTTQWTLVGGSGGASSGGIAVGATLWAGEVSLNDDAPDVFDLPSGLQNGDILTIMYDLYVGTTPDDFFVTGVNMGRTFNVVVGEHLTSVQFSAFYNAGGSQGGVISDNGTMDIDCTVSQLTVIVRGGESYPVGSRITVKRIYKSADNNPAYN